MEGAEVLGEVEMAEVREMIIRKRQEIKLRGGEGALVIAL